MADSYLGKPPSDPSELAEFPAFTLEARSTLYRVHREARGAWFFSDDPDFRFTPLGMSHQGACYLAEQPVAALLEALRGERSVMVAEDDVRRRRLFTVELDRDLRLAHLDHKNAGRKGVNAEVHTTTDYEKTHRWASALRQAGFDGLRYLCRSDPSLEQVGFALFDDQGAPAPGRWPVGEDAEISDALIAEAAEAGLKILPTP